MYTHNIVFIYIIHGTVFTYSVYHIERSIYTNIYLLGKKDFNFDHDVFSYSDHIRSTIQSCDR